jgi:RNA polymerase sigma-70 factor (ECF subfamily)
MFPAYGTFTGMQCRCSAWIDELARENARRLVRLARREGVPASDALDVVQEAFVLLVRRHDACEKPEHAARTLAVMVRNAARNHRRLHRHARPHLDVDEVALVTNADPNVALAHVESADQLAGCMAQLDDVPRRIITLRILEEHSGAEAAEALGLTAGHVAVLLHRAKKDLERCMLMTA